MQRIKIELEDGVQILPAIEDSDHDCGRAETGPMKFGEDWSGVFIRGDDCEAFLRALNGDPMKNGGDAAIVGRLIELLESSQE